MIVVYSFLNVCVVIAGYHNHRLVEIAKYVGTTCKGSNGSCLASLSGVHLLLYSSDNITYYDVPHVYIFMLFVYVIKLLLKLYLVH